MEETVYSVAVSDNGEQVMMSGPPDAVMGVVFSEGGQVEPVHLDIDEDEFNHLQDLASTNDIPDDTIKAKAINI